MNRGRLGRSGWMRHRKRGLRRMDWNRRKTRGNKRYKRRMRGRQLRGLRGTNNRRWR